MKLLLNYSLFVTPMNTQAEDTNVETSNKPLVYKEILKCKLYFWTLMSLKWLHLDMCKCDSCFKTAHLTQSDVLCHCFIHSKHSIHKGLESRHHHKSMLLDYIFKQNILQT